MARFQYGEKQEAIQEAIKTELDLRLPECGLSPLTISLNEMRLAVKASLPEDVSLNRMEVLNSVLKDPKLGEEVAVANKSGETYLTFYSKALKNALEIVYAEMERIANKKALIFPTSS